MLRSMTGYATASASSDGASVTVTLKSVNHRFLDLHLRLPPELDSFEPRIRQALRNRLARGHVDVTIAVDRAGAVEVHFDRSLVRGYFEAFHKLREEMHLEAQPDINALLKLPGVVNVMAAGSDADAEALDRMLFEALERAMDSLDKMRCHEGEVLCRELLDRATLLESLASKIAALREGSDKRIFDRLKTRIAELAGAVASPDRIAQEAALLAERGDVSEEIVRLKSHCDQFRNTLNAPPKGGETGKRFDFLLQEMNREANTILSKTAGDGAGLEITDLAIQAKSEIEKLREQVQNLQ